MARSPTVEEREDIQGRFEAAHARLRDTLFRIGQHAFGVTSDAALNDPNVPEKQISQKRTRWVATTLRLGAFILSD